MNETIKMTSEIMDAEEQSVRIEYYTLDGKKPEIFMCPGDFIIICNVLHDYAALLSEISEDDLKDNLTKFQYSYHMNRCKKIQMRIEEALGYSTEKALVKCRKKQARENTDDIAEDALVLAAGRRKRKQEQKTLSTDRAEDPEIEEVRNG